MPAHKPRFGEVTLGKAPRALAVARGVGPVLPGSQHCHLGAFGAPATAQAEPLHSEEVYTELLLWAPYRVRADHLVGVVLPPGADQGPEQGSGLNHCLLLPRYPTSQWCPGSPDQVVGNPLPLVGCPPWSVVQIGAAILGVAHLHPPPQPLGRPSPHG